jgi:hypothetical protein
VLGKPYSDQRVIAVVFALLLSAMLLLVSMSSPPTVPLSQVPAFDDGTVVVIFGVLVDIYLRDGGAESFVLADITEGTTLRIYCSDGLRDRPSQLLLIGDEVRVQGEVSCSGSSPIVFTTSDGVTLSKKAESVLSVEALGRNWALFEGDSFRMCGLVIPGETSGSFRLADPKTQHSIALRSDSELTGFVGKRVTVTALLRLDQETMSLVLIASSVSPGLS